MTTPDPRRAVAEKLAERLERHRDNLQTNQTCPTGSEELWVLLDDTIAYLRSLASPPEPPAAAPDERVERLRELTEVADEAANYFANRNLGEPARILMGKLINRVCRAQAALAESRK